jgi:hypothetical protein
LRLGKCLKKEAVVEEVRVERAAQEWFSVVSVEPRYPGIKPNGLLDILRWWIAGCLKSYRIRGQE